MLGTSSHSFGVRGLPPPIAPQARRRLRGGSLPMRQVREGGGREHPQGRGWGFRGRQPSNPGGLGGGMPPGKLSPGYMKADSGEIEVLKSWTGVRE